MNSQQEPKQVIIVRSDLRNSDGQKVRTGKLMAQVAHASLKAILSLGVNDGKNIMIPLEEPAVKQWLDCRFTKICVSVNSEMELLEIYNKAEKLGLPCSLIRDAGLTEFDGVPTYTTVAVGPGYPSDIDPITRHLKLL